MSAGCVKDAPFSALRVSAIRPDQAGLHDENHAPASRIQQDIQVWSSGSKTSFLGGRSSQRDEVGREFDLLAICDDFESTIPSLGGVDKMLHEGGRCDLDSIRRHKVDDFQMLS